MWKAARPKKWPSGWIVPKPRCARTLPTRASSYAVTWPEGDADMSKHPSEATLALFTGGELGRFAHWRVGHHLEECNDCRRQVAGFSELREEVAGVGEVPELDWNRLAAEMKANIRLGLEAGECVSRRSLPRAVFSLRAPSACTSLAALLGVILPLEQPTPRGEKGNAPDETVLQAAFDVIHRK